MLEIKENLTFYDMKHFGPFLVNIEVGFNIWKLSEMFKTSSWGILRLLKIKAVIEHNPLNFTSKDWVWEIDFIEIKLLEAC